MTIDIKKCEIKIIVDSREQKWDHIETKFKQRQIDYFVSKGKQSLKVGDYSIVVKTPKGNILDFRNYTAVERKGSLNEIACNLTDSKSKDENGKIRFVRELERSFSNRTRLLLLIEEEDGYNKAKNGFFRGDFPSFFNPKSFMGMINAYQARYLFSYQFCERKADSWSMIYDYLYYQAREWMKEFNEDSLKHWSASEKGNSPNYYYISGNLDTIYN